MPLLVKKNTVFPMVVRFLSLLCFSTLFFFFFGGTGSAQNSTVTPTDPYEVEALNTIFRKWGISSVMSRSLRWNITDGNPCTGAAVDSAEDVKINPVDHGFNPSVVCQCFENICHITKLTVSQLNVTGTIPDELQNLTRLAYLELGDNYLTGPLPPFIGRFTSLSHININKNALSGSLPKELGNLTNLVSLGMGMNNFSGSLPPDIGNMTSLKEIYFSSTGVSGPLPEELAKLSLNTLFANDNNIGGKIPEFIGNNLTGLTALRFQGNNFQGPIPLNLVNLINLRELRLGDLLNESSSLDFMRNMKSLGTLILRNSRISGSIPSNINEFANLKFLDLSFNNISGTLPSSIFNIPELEFIYLGNNNIVGEIPNGKSNSLVNIDLSYNELSGSIPDWKDQRNLKLNLVGNDFTAKESQTVLPSGLECLQKNYPCFRNSPRYYSFAINCGGEKYVSKDGTEYEADNQDAISTASFYVSDTKRWAVSNTGKFVDSVNAMYIEKTENNITDTLDPILYQRSRLSSSSLRYFGLGLENGNYTVNLKFAELVFPDDNSIFKKTARRIFDIYIQEELTFKDFNIKKDAGGIPFKAVDKTLNAIVTDNILQIHFFWEGKGTCCLPAHRNYGPLISAISVKPNFKPTVSNQPPSDNDSNTLVKVVAIVVPLVIALVGLGVLFGICRRIQNKKKERLLGGVDNDLEGISTVTYSFVQLKNATNNFKLDSKVGEGGFGVVYKGEMNDGSSVAIKKLVGETPQGKQQFVAEVATISGVKHRNLVTLHGCCYEGNKRLLVYEYMKNGSLDKALYGKSGQLKLDWNTRFAICLGTARGLAYLHEESRLRIIHRDVKSSNILLDKDLTPKISDFGLAKLYDEKMTHISTRVAGTRGYLAPEYAMRGHLTEKVDVFSFGVVVFEILSGRSCSDESYGMEKKFVLDWAWSLHEKDNDLDILDPKLEFEDVNRDEAMRMMNVAFICTQVNPTLRPSMSRVIAILIGDMKIDTLPERPSYMRDWQFDDLSTVPSTASITTFGTQITSNQTPPTTSLAADSPSLSTWPLEQKLR